MGLRSVEPALADEDVLFLDGGIPKAHRFSLRDMMGGNQNYAREPNTLLTSIFKF
jgi:hypothetical protein